MIAPETAPGQAAYEVWRAAIPDYVCNVPAGPWEELPETIQAGFVAIAAREAQPAPGAQADRDRYYEALQRIVDAVAAGDAAAVDKLARNALGLTRVGRPGPFQPAPELAAAMREARGYREALESVRAIILEGDNSTEGSRLRRSRAVIRSALEGK